MLIQYKTVSCDILDQVSTEQNNERILTRNSLYELTQLNTNISIGIDQLVVKSKSNDKQSVDKSHTTFQRQQEQQQQQQQHQFNSSNTVKKNNATNIYVKNLPQNLNASSLQNYFGIYGQISSYKIVQRRKAAFINYNALLQPRKQ